MPRRLMAVALVVLLAHSADARRRALAPPGPTDPATPSGWLYANARVLDSDLSPLRGVAGEATVVALGDGSHGSHEFSAMKVRMIRYLVEQMDFDVVGIEASFPPVNRLNAYIQGGGGDPRAILRDMEKRLTYFFWNTEELLGLVEWMRAYNAHRGTRRAIELVGVDAFDDVTAAADVVAYLRTVDPEMAVVAETGYACVSAPGISPACRQNVHTLRTHLASREAQYVAVTSVRAYQDALRNASVIFAASQFARDRDKVMADGVLWMQRYRSTSGKVIYWAHNEHVSEETDNVFDAGTRIARHLGEARYAAIAMMSGPGSFVGWKPDATGRRYTLVTGRFPPPAEGMYEWYFRQRRGGAVLVPLTGTLPEWLNGFGKYRYGGSDGVVVERPIALAKQFDAVVYIDVTTPLRLLQ